MHLLWVSSFTQIQYFLKLLSEADEGTCLQESRFIFVFHFVMFSWGGCPNNAVFVDVLYLYTDTLDIAVYTG
jgi:hypothetical protein